MKRMLIGSMAVHIFNTGGRSELETYSISVNHHYRAGSGRATKFSLLMIEIRFQRSSRQKICGRGRFVLWVRFCPCQVILTMRHESQDLAVSTLTTTDTHIMSSVCICDKIPRTNMLIWILTYSWKQIVCVWDQTDTQAQAPRTLGMGGKV